MGDTTLDCNVYLCYFHVKPKNGFEKYYVTRLLFFLLVKNIPLNKSLTFFCSQMSLKTHQNTWKKMKISAGQLMEASSQWSGTAPQLSMT